MASGDRAISAGRSGAHELQRARILTATIGLIAEVGVTRTSGQAIIRRARVSRSAFYAHFRTHDACIAAAFEHALEVAHERAAPAYAAERGWRSQIRAALHALLELLEQRRDIAELLIIRSATVDGAAGERRRDILRRLAELIEAGANDSRASRSPLAAQALAAGAVSVIEVRLLEARREPLTALLNPLMGIIVLPYRGGPAAAAELKRAPPRANPTSQRRSARTGARERGFDACPMGRVTYRTMRVFTALHERAPLSNVEVAKHADVKDQGQISKLLHRLAREGLVDNSGLAQPSGHANAWRLTDAGRQVLGAMEQDGLIARAVRSGEQQG
ncbi:MAG TPA: TetR/AcrR family transcriptional regulator [Solirubrobacteraceae bacterium]|nr:TetR/AcrR family transcriptional regulator [Solirubrobacteraceae bacterium]